MDRASCPPEIMPAAVRARTILAGCHHGWVQPRRPMRWQAPSSAGAGGTVGSADHGGTDGNGTDDAVLLGLVDVDGAPFVLLQHWEDVPPGPVRITCTEMADELGMLTLSGTLGRRIEAARVPGVVESLHLGAPCGDPCLWCPGPQLAVMPMTVEGVRVVAPAAHGLARPTSVSRTAFRSAHPDRWMLHGGGVAEHLETHHQPELLGVVREAGLAGVTAVSVRAVDADGLVLTALARDGVGDVVLPFAPRLADPRRLAERLAAGS